MLHTETNQPISIANQMTDFYATQPLTEKYFLTGSANISCVMQQGYYIHTTIKCVNFQGVLLKEITTNQQLEEELKKPVIRKFKKRKMYPSFKDTLKALYDFKNKQQNCIK